MEKEERLNSWNTVDGLPYCFTGVQVLSRNVIFLRGVLKKLEQVRVPFTFVVRYEHGAWSPYTIDHDVTSHCVVDGDHWQVFSLCMDGNVHVASPSGSHLEHVDPTNEGPNSRCWMLDIKPIGTSIFAVGMSRKIYRRLQTGEWRRANEGAGATTETEIETGFRSIDGWDETSMVCVGLHGEIWQGDGKLWHQLDSPTNVTLHCVQCLPDGRAYACGARGVVLEMKMGQWTAIDHNSTKDNLWALREFQGVLYFVSDKALFQLTPGSAILEKIRNSVELGPSYGSLHAKDGVLWSVGKGDLAAFDGRNWRRAFSPSWPTAPGDARL